VKLVERFKEEASGIESHQELDFPTPLPEGRFPGGIVVALCLIIGAGVFAGWYWFQNQNTIEGARIPPPPAAPEQASAPADGDVPAPEIERTPLASPAAPAVTPEAAPPVEAAVVADGVNESGETVAEVTEPAVPLVPPSYLEPQIDPLAPMADLPSIGNETAADASAPTEAGATATPGPRVDLSSSDNGQIYGAVNSDARIVVNALANTWVQVRDADENVVLTQMLRAGDKYLVPNRSGLWLMTGNAGGLDISVDGEPVPAIGARGESRRNVRLDTDLLRTGGAVVQ
jgi:cytoskeleton protein RodZ